MATAQTLEASANALNFGGYFFALKREDVVQMQSAQLMQVSYFDPKAEIRLECYADTVVTEQDGKFQYIAAIRLGGYPEAVKGISEAIYGGGSVTCEIFGEDKTLSARVKQYHRELSHDGIYAEAVLRVKDEEHRAANNSGEDGVPESTANTDNEPPAANAPRKCYIFCAAGDEEQLFEEIDEKISVPLIPEFREYVLSEFRSRGILKPLNMVTTHEKFEVWVLSMDAEEKNVIAAINDGLRSGAISIPGASETKFPVVRGVTEYLNNFGVQIAKRIKEQFNPLFDPATEEVSPEVVAVNAFVNENTGYNLYNAQLAVVEAHKRCFEIKKDTICIGECGTGKSKIGTSALHAYQQRHQFRGGNSGAHKKCFNIILCPSHIAKKWIREIEETLPNTFATIVTSITELNEAYEAYQRDDHTCYVIITKEKARDGYMLRPAAIWNKRRKRFICPDCHKSIKTELSDCGSKYKVNVDHYFFRKENKNNRKCDECGSMLWAALTPEYHGEWVKISEYGFVHRVFAEDYLQFVESKPKIHDAIQAVADNPDGTFPNGGAYRRVALSSYIKRRFKGKIDGLVVDELHNYNNNSGQGDAMGELFQTAKKVVGMTATLINGYSSGIFHLLYRISPHLMLRDNKSYEKPIDFNNEYGVTESVYEIDAPDYNANRRTSKRKLRERQLPGVSPLVYTRFLIENAAFLSLNDMGKELPEYEEIPIPMYMSDEVAEEYNRIERDFIDTMKHDRKYAKKLLSAYLNLMTVYPDQPYDQNPIRHPVFDSDIFTPNDTSSPEELHEKERQVLDLVQRKLEEGERVLIYTSWTRIDTQEKLTKLLAEQGHRIAVLTAKVPPKKREEWVEKQVQSGVRVLISNPTLVETGLDLNDFTTLIYYNISYNLFTLRQASRRSWRINQRAPRIEVYFFFYDGTMQHRAIRLMASKLAVAGVIEGSNFSDEGLAAMSDCQDMTTALARELTQGIEGEVEDLGEVFKRMALLKPKADIIEGEADVVDVKIVAETDAPFAQSAQVKNEPARPKRPVYSSGGLLSLARQKPKNPTKKKPVPVMEGQMSLFDFLDSTA